MARSHFKGLLRKRLFAVVLHPAGEGKRLLTEARQGRLQENEFRQRLATSSSLARNTNFESLVDLEDSDGFV